MVNKKGNDNSPGFNSQSTGLYIHIPFCVSKCVYCDFLSLANAGADLTERYKDALVDELNGLRKLNHTIDTVYIGGGTPTALPLPFLLEIIEAVNGFNLTADAEFTVEMNPGSVNSSFETFKALRRRGVNRLSIGLQAWQDELLRSLSRIHTRRQFIDNFRAARAAGIKHISVDLMFALPGQTTEQWIESITAVAALRPEHISAYSLTPEEGTPLWAGIQSGRITLPGDEADREMYHTARGLLASRGYEHYELSNFALPGCESRHNTRYWTRAPYIGAGLGAHGFDGSCRKSNTADMNKYLTGSRVENDSEHITARGALAEEMLLGLRMTRGVKRHPLFKKEIDGLIQRGLLTERGGRVTLTELGMDLANQVFIVFLE
jgi:oxygen-independent coproporphyrinogen-3 oxidase